MASLPIAAETMRGQEWGYWVFENLHPQTCEDPEPFDLNHLEANDLPFDDLVYSLVDFLCLNSIADVQDYRSENYGRSYGPDATMIVNPDIIGHSTSLKERFVEDREFFEMLVANIHNCVQLDIGFLEWADRGLLESLSKREELTNPDAEQDNLIATYLGVSLQIVLDIRHVLQGHESDAFHELQATGKRATEIIRGIFRAGPNEVSQMHHQKPMGHKMLSVAQFIAFWVNQDPVMKILEEDAVENGDSEDLVFPHFSLLKHHPLLCGRITHHINSLISGNSILFDASQDAILSTVNLYNAAKQSNHLTNDWPDIEYLISLHRKYKLILHTDSELFVKGPTLCNKAEPVTQFPSV